MFRKTSITSPAVVAAMPAEATRRGSTRSERLPAIGEQMTMTTGCATRIRPACSGEKPLMYCR